jgi:hypothetical protein
MSANKLLEKGNLKGLRDELNALANIFEKPFAMKAMIMNQNIPELAEQFDKALFVWIRRDPVFNIQSALEARIRQYGDINTWYSFKIKEYPQLKNLNPLESVAGQIFAINRSIEEGMSGIPEENKLIVEYEDFCKRPSYYYDKIVNLLEQQAGVGLGNITEYSGEKAFNQTNHWRLKEYSKNEVENICNTL